jgi:DNA invertase Pin-like site-specific DNA recombinase
MIDSHIIPPRTLAAAYIRYSSNMQDDNFTLDAQLRQIKSRAQADGVVIVKVYSDPATSAYTKRYRPGIVEMLQGAHKKEFHFLYVHKVDRLARRLEWAIDIAKQIEKDGVILKAVEQNFDLGTPEGKLMFHLLGSLGEFYSDNLSKETHKGKYERAKQGYHNGIVPWGYTSEEIENRKLAVPNPDTAPALKQAYERFSTGLYYDQDMADWANELGYRTSKGRLFTKDAMRDILQNPFYKGDVHYRGQLLRGGKVRRRAQAEYVKGLHTPLIDEELFNKCQQVRASRRRKANSKQTTRRVYLLSGILSCNHCGRRLRAQSTRKFRYYREASRFGGVDCAFNGKSVRADEIEKEISKLMESLVLPENWQATLQEILNQHKDEIDPNQEKARLRGEIRRMREAYKRGLYEGDEHTFWREVEGHQMQLDALEQLTPFEVRQAGRVLANLQNAWRSATPDEQREICNIILDKIVFDFALGKIAKITPKPEYEVLFRIVDKPEIRADSHGENSGS